MQEVIGIALRKGEMQDWAWEKLNCSSKGLSGSHQLLWSWGGSLERVDPK